MNTLTYRRVTYRLPISNTRFHIFHLTDFNITELKLNIAKSTWLNVGDEFNGSNICVEIFSNMGLNIPKALIWILRVNNTVLFAIKSDSIFTELSDGVFHLRISENRIYATDVDAGEYLTESLIFTSTADIVRYQNKIRTFTDYANTVKCFRNGYLVPDITPGIFSVGDWCEYEYVGACDSAFEVLVDDLRAFLSNYTEVPTSKYLLHNPELYDYVTHFKDLEIYLINENGVGVNYLPLEPKDLTMVTNHDYGIPVEAVDRLTALNTAIFENEDYRYIKVYVYNSPSRRQLVDTNNKLIELNRLTGDAYLDVLTNDTPVVAAWHAATLEVSPYTKLMSVKYSEINIELVSLAYGYDSIVNNFYNPYITNTSSTSLKQFELRLGHSGECTIFKYDSSGRLRENPAVYSDLQLDTVTESIPNIDIETYEVWLGSASDTINITSNVTSMLLDPALNYRVYAKSKNNTQTEQTWFDVTNDLTYVIIDNNELSVVANLGLYEIMILDDSKFLAKQFDIDTYKGVYEFNLIATYVDQDGNSIVLNPEIPPARLDVFMNGHLLIPGVNMAVDYPKVTVQTMEYVDLDKAEQVFYYRQSGFCTPDMEMEEPYETGYVKAGYISDDDVFDLHGGKAVGIYVDGKLVDPSSVTYKENYDGIRTSNYEGLPYIILNPIVNLSRDISTISKDLRFTDAEMQKSISDYLTVEINDPEGNNVSNIVDYISMYSTLISRLVFAFENGIESMSLISTPPSNDTIRAIVNRHVEYLNIDPCVMYVDSPYVKVQPMPVSAPRPLNVTIFTFLQKVNSIYLNKKVNLNSFFTITY
jgi:hypothetical protein